MWTIARSTLLSISNDFRLMYQRGYVLRKLNKLPTRDVYIIDSNLVIGFHQDDVIHWRRWASKQISIGKKFFYLDPVASLVKEVSPGFEQLLWQNERHPFNFDMLEEVYREIESALDIRGNKVSKLKTCVQMICLAGHAARAAGLDRDIDQDRRNVVFATTNFQAVRRVLGNEDKVAVVKKILERRGLGPLVNVRLITRSGTWRDIPSKFSDVEKSSKGGPKGFTGPSLARSTSSSSLPKETMSPNFHESSNSSR